MAKKLNVTKRIFFSPSELYNVFMDALMDVAQITARRLEEEATQLLNDRMKGDKSSGTLADSIRGFVILTQFGVEINIMASAVESGQWEMSVGESEEARYAASGYDYAIAVEEGTVDVEAKSSQNMVYWLGGYRESASGEPNRILIKQKANIGQPGLHFMEDAIINIQDELLDLLNQVVNNINIDKVWKERR